MKKRFSSTEQEGLKRIADLIRQKREVAIKETDKCVNNTHTPEINRNISGRRP